MPDTDTPPISPLVAQLMEASLRQAHDVTNRLIESLTAQVSDANATLDAIRATVTAMFHGPYMPTPHAVLNALYPDAETVDMFREGSS